MSKKNSNNNEPTEEQKRAAQLQQMKKKNPANLKAEIFRLRDQLKEMVETSKGLENAIIANQDIYLKETERIGTDLKAQEEMLTEIENQYSFKEKAYKEQIEKIRRKYEEEQEMSELKKKREVEMILMEQEKLQKRVDHLRNFPEREKQYQESMEELNARHEKLIKSQEKDIGNIRNQHRRQRQKIDKDTQVEMERIKQAEVNKLEKKLTREQYIKKENDVMEKEIKMCEENKEILQREYKELIEQIEKDKSQQIDSHLGNQASQTYERSLRIIKLEQKLSKLKAYLQEETAKLTKQHENLDSVYQKQFQDLESKISKTEGWLRMKERDLKKVKACSQMVLNQRNNLECYLLQVFYEHPEVDYKDERSINKILRFLFAKINSKKPPVNYKNFVNASRTHTLNSSISQN